MEMDIKLTEKQELVCTAAEAALSLIIGVSTSRGVEVLGAGLADTLIPTELLPKYERAVKTTTKIAGKVLGGRLAAAYAKDISDVMRGACHGYNAGRQMAQRQTEC